MLEASFCRILDLGAKSGTSDTAMAEISWRMDDRVQLEIARKVGIPPFSVGRYQSQSRHFSTARLKEMLEQCVETEYLFKRGRIEDQIGVELLLVQFTKQ